MVNSNKNKNRFNKVVNKENIIDILLGIIQEFIHLGVFGIWWLNILGLSDVPFMIWVFLVILESAIEIWIDSRERKRGIHTVTIVGGISNGESRNSTKDSKRTDD